MLVHRTSLSPFVYPPFFVNWFFYLICSTTATITSRTIDDALGDLITGQKVIYEPADIWQTFNYSFASGGTFTRAQSTGNISATLTFNGTAIYVFFMIPSEAFPHDIPFATSFSLDGGPPELFQPSPDLNTPLSDVDELVFSKTDLIATQHTLVISASPSENVSHFIDFDYAIYEYDDGEVVSSTAPSPSVYPLSPSPSPSQAYPPTGMVSATAPQQSTGPKTSSWVLPCVIVVTAFIVGVLALVLFLLRPRKLRKQREGIPSIEIDPAEDEGPENTSSNMSEPSGGGASINPFDNGHASEAPSASAFPINVMGQPPSIYSNGNAYSGAPLLSLRIPKAAHFGIRPPGQTDRGIRGVPLNPLRIVNRASSTIPSATTANGDASRRRILEERLSTYLLMMQQKADEMSTGTESEAKADEPRVRTEEEAEHWGYSQEKAKYQEDEDIDVWLKRMADPDVGVKELKEVIHAMKLQIEALRAQRGVDQTVGPFEDPPPLYTPATPSSKRRRMTGTSNESKDSPVSPTVVDKWRAAVARFSRIALSA